MSVRNQLTHYVTRRQGRHSCLLSQVIDKLISSYPSSFAFPAAVFSVVDVVPLPLPGSVCALTFTELDIIFFRNRILIYK